VAGASTRLEGRMRVYSAPVSYVIDPITTVIKVKRSPARLAKVLQPSLA